MDQAPNIFITLAEYGIAAAMASGFIWYLMKQNTDQKERNAKQQEQLLEITRGSVKAIENNTQALRAVEDRLRDIRSK